MTLPFTETPAVAPLPVAAGPTSRPRANGRFVAAPFEETLAANTRVDAETGCWIWTACINHKGYGIVHRTKDRAAGPAHRWAWLNLRGPIADGMHLDHLCRERACVNPDHLEPVTVTENNRRSRIARGMSAECRHGSAEPADCPRCTAARERKRRRRAEGLPA